MVPPITPERAAALRASLKMLFEANEERLRLAEEQVAAARTEMARVYRALVPILDGIDGVLAMRPAPLTSANALKDRN